MQISLDKNSKSKIVSQKISIYGKNFITKDSGFTNRIDHSSKMGSMLIDRNFFKNLIFKSFDGKSFLQNQNPPSHFSDSFYLKADASNGGSLFSAPFPRALMPLHSAQLLHNSTTNTTKAPRRLTSSKLPSLFL